MYFEIKTIMFIISKCSFYLTMVLVLHMKIAFDSCISLMANMMKMH